MNIFAFTSILITFLSGAFGLSNGIDACVDAPNHGSWGIGCSPSGCTNASMFPIQLNNMQGQPTTSYNPNMNYSVILGNAASAGTICTDTTCFKGFSMNVGLGSIAGPYTSVSALSQNAGILVKDPRDPRVRQMTSCYNGLTHTSNANIRQIRGIWTAPPAGSGTVTFKSIIVTSQTGLNYMSSFIVNENIRPMPSNMRTPLPTNNNSLAQCIILPSTLSGSWRGTTVGTAIGISGNCNGVSFNERDGGNLLVLTVPDTATLGGFLTVDTCNGTTWDTELIVSAPLVSGTCPSSSFTCAAANDDTQGCGVGTQARVSVPTVPGASHAVIVTGFGSSSGPYTLSWSYGQPITPSSSATVRASRTSSSTITMTPSPTRSLSMGILPSTTSSASLSNSNTITPSSSSTPSSTNSRTSSVTSSVSASPLETDTPSITISPSISLSNSITSSITPSASSSITALATSYSSNTAFSTTSLSITALATSTSSSSISWSSSSKPIALGSSNSNNDSGIGYIGLGVGVGVISTIIIIGAYYVAHKHNKNKRPHSMRNVIFLGEKENYTSKNPSSAKVLSSSSLTIPIESEEMNWAKPYTKNNEQSGRISFDPMNVKKDGSV